AGGMLSLGDFLWKQGLIWFLLAAVAEVPPTVSFQLGPRRFSFFIISIFCCRRSLF
ncbi:hypothetical protein BGW80DRAFT_1301357, partial [Lactifluus volemus]